MHVIVNYKYFLQLCAMFRMELKDSNTHCANIISPPKQ